MKNDIIKRAGMLALAAVFGLGGVAGAQKPRKQKPRQIPQTGVEDVQPATPASTEGEALLEQMTSRSTEGLVEVQHDDGAVSVYLEGRFMNVMLASPAGDGAAATATCQTGAEALKQAGANRTGRAARTPGGVKPEPVFAPIPLVPMPMPSASREVK